MVSGNGAFGKLALKGCNLRTLSEIARQDECRDSGGLFSTDEWFCSGY